MGFLKGKDGEVVALTTLKPTKDFRRGKLIRRLNMKGKYDDALLEAITTFRPFTHVLREHKFKQNEIKTAVNMRKRILRRLIRMYPSIFKNELLRKQHAMEKLAQEGEEAVLGLGEDDDYRDKRQRLGFFKEVVETMKMIDEMGKEKEESPKVKDVTPADEGLDEEI